MRISKTYFFTLVILLPASAAIAQIFTRIATGDIVNDGGISASAAWGDYNNDGRLDLFVANHDDEDNFLYRNDGDPQGTGQIQFFRVTTGEIVNDGGDTHGGTWGDYNNDGYLDLFAPNWTSAPSRKNLLYQNSGDGTFTKITAGSVVNDEDHSEVASWADYDNDGDLDLLVTQNPPSAIDPGRNFLYQNTGNGNFDRLTNEVVVNDEGGFIGCSWADYDNDGDLDLFVCNFEGPNFLYQNNVARGRGFLKITEGPIVTNSRASVNGSWADYDNDGDLDLFVANWEGRNALYRNDGMNTSGQITFVEIDTGMIVDEILESASGSWGDYDNDGDLDLFLATGALSDNVLYQNTGDGTFTSISGELVGSQTDGGVWGDYDNDGDLDLFVANRPAGGSGSENNFLYRNNGNNNTWINIRCVGTTSNTSAIGARVSAKATLSGKPTWQIREISAQTGRGQNSLNVEFGFRDATVIDSLRIRWPSGIVYDTTNVAVNQFLTITERQFIRITEGDAVTDGGSSFGSSWADYDNDGDPDLFVTNTGQNNILYRNDGPGELIAVTADVAVNSDGGNSQSSSWGDFNNDGNADLFVANTGNNFLYKNNGDGSFRKIEDAPPVNDASNSRGSAWADFDNDGDLDLVVANSGNNALFENNGDGSFTRIEAGDIVTDGGDSFGCSWADYDGDGNPDLFVANTGNNFLYYNNGDGSFRKITSAAIVTDNDNSSGGSWADYDNDGDPDLIVTNLNNNILYQNTGNGNFEKIDNSPIIAADNNSFGSSWADYDNDGDLDLFIANSGSNALFRNSGDGTFSEITFGVIANNGGSSFGSSWADYDRNGIPDLFVPNLGTNNFLYQVFKNGNQWINIQLAATASNKSAMGARVFAMANIAGKPVRQLREISGQSGYLSQNSLDAAFGLGNAEAVDSVRVEWPSGAINVFQENLPINQFLTLRENNRPVLSNAISAITLSVDSAQFEANLEVGSAAFIDRDDDPLTYSVFSTDEDIARAFISDAILTVLLADETKAGQVKIFLTADDGRVDDGRGATETMTIDLNRPPLIASEIPDQTVLAQQGSNDRVIADLRDVFNDPDQDELLFEVSGFDSSIAVATISGSVLAISPGDSAGNILLTVSANDGRGGINSFRFSVRNVLENTAPVLTGNTIGDQILLLNGEPFSRDLNSVFSDAENPTLIFRTSTPDLDVAIPTIISDTLIVTPQDTGLAVITVRANDNLGGEASTQFNIEVLRSFRPEITHDAVVSQNFNQPISIEADIVDDEGALESAILNYRMAGDVAFQVLPLDTAYLNETTFRVTGTIPGTAVTNRGVEYFILAKDTHDVVRREPASGIISVKVRVEAPGISRDSPQPGGDEQSAYRLISFPLNIDSPEPAAVLEDNLGSYDPAQWRLSQWVPQPNGGVRKAEFPNTASITPGSAFWLIIRDAGKIIDSGAGITVSTEENFAILLNAGWNLVGNPFNFPAATDSILSDGSRLQMYAYENGAWSDQLNPLENPLQPFEGYAVFARSAAVMFIQPKILNTANLLTKKVAREAPLWAIRILAHCQGARDENNILAVSPNASRAWDQLDAPEPPAVGQYISVYFPHPEWEALSRNFSTDFRPVSPEGDEWVFEVKSNIQDIIKVTISGIENLPPQHAAWLIDKDLKISRNLRKNNQYAVAGNGEQYPKRLTLIVGKEDYLNEKLKDFQVLPASYQLFQNFPNPFNPATTIRFSLPNPEKVTLKVYDMLGKEVRTLIDNASREAGYHAVVWDGRNAIGAKAASGVYFIWLQAPQFAKTRKMLMLQ